MVVLHPHTAAVHRSEASPRPVPEDGGCLGLQLPAVPVPWSCRHAAPDTPTGRPGSPAPQGSAPVLHLPRAAPAESFRGFREKRVRQPVPVRHRLRGCPSPPHCRVPLCPPGSQPAHGALPSHHAALANAVGPSRPLLGCKTPVCAGVGRLRARASGKLQPLTEMPEIYYENQ